MSTAEKSYLLAGAQTELERLQLQARVWESDAEALFDAIPLEPGWDCLDVGCGAMGVLGPLGRRVGSSGRVLGIDVDQKLLAAAQLYVETEGLTNVELQERDAFATGLPSASFDLVHVRFVFAPCGHADELLAELLRLVRPGGYIAIQELEPAAWSCYPPRAGWDRLKAALIKAFSLAGGDPLVAQRTYGMLRHAGLAGVQIRAAVLALHSAHPYMRLPIQFATALRQLILKGGLLQEAELDAAIAECEELVRDPDTFVTTFIINQVWGRKP